MQSQAISDLQQAIYSKLSTWIPEKLRSLKIQSPTYCLFIWYQDLSVDELTPIIATAPVEMRDACFAREHRSNLGDEPRKAIWTPQQSISAPFPGWESFKDFPCDVVAQDVDALYRLLSAHLTRPPEDEMELLMPVRTVLSRVAQDLNQVDWSGILPCSEDFVVLATDYIGAWLVEDMSASIPKPALLKLKKKKLLPK